MEADQALPPTSRRCSRATKAGTQVGLCDMFLLFNHKVTRNIAFTIRLNTTITLFKLSQRCFMNEIITHHQASIKPITQSKDNIIELKFKVILYQQKI